jgi:methylthioxylose transferase
VVQHTAARPEAAPRRTRPVRWDLAAAGGAAVLVAVAAVVGVWLDRLPGHLVFAAAPPLFASWLPHAGPGTPAAVLLALVVVLRGPDLADRLPWRRALAAGYAAAVAWTFALALVDGWQRGLASRLTSGHEYLHEVPGVTDIGAMLRGFTGRILDFRPDSWTTHVAGHPPGALLVFVWMDRLGLSGGGWAALACVLVGCLAAVAVPVTLRAVGAEPLARAALPFAVLFPGAVWVGASADGLFTGVTASGIALLAVSARAGRGARVAGCLAGGVLLGFGAFLSYGLVLVAGVAMVVPLLLRRWGAAGLAAVGAAAVVAAFAWAGFWWPDGYHLVVARYYQGIGAERWYAYWVWADLAALALATGPAAVAGLRRAAVVAVRSIRAPDGRAAVVALAGAAGLAVLAADLSGLSKAEVERIWLPFAVWLTSASALLPAPTRRWWLAGQAFTALAVNHLLLTNW